MLVLSSFFAELSSSLQRPSFVQRDGVLHCIEEQEEEV
jgi:hypothetical protein